MDYFDPFAGPFWATVGYAILCGGIIGLERQFHGKTVGVRTSILICLGTAVFIGLGAAASGGAGDPVRVLGQVVTGMGFIGAGVIISQGGEVRGVTTAAGIWLLAPWVPRSGSATTWGRGALGYDRRDPRWNRVAGGRDQPAGAPDARGKLTLPRSGVELLSGSVAGTLGDVGQARTLRWVRMSLAEISFWHPPRHPR